MTAKDTFQLKPEDIKEALYMSDVDTNEACVHSLLMGEVLVVVFKMGDTDDRDFVSKSPVSISVNTFTTIYQIENHLLKELARNSTNIIFIVISINFFNQNFNILSKQLLNCIGEKILNMYY